VPVRRAQKLFQVLLKKGIKIEGERMQLELKGGEKTSPFQESSRARETRSTQGAHRIRKLYRRGKKVKKKKDPPDKK